ncbi:hypothetical protein [Ponticaulis koreensis]|uniref:hypothetical protein n=1 Tax=Ponticaulis koreensis TaxID=1123045 RepID=UPI0012DC8C5F|nr:hypothetical protein [Ponticaulis koreensis]
MHSRAWTFSISAAIATCCLVSCSGSLARHARQPDSAMTLCSLRAIASDVEQTVTVEAFVRDEIRLLRDGNCPDFAVPYEVSRAETNGGLQFEQMVNASDYYASDVQAVFTGRLVKLDEHLVLFELTDVRDPTFVPLD